jgi:hypothetical protein
MRKATGIAGAIAAGAILTSAALAAGINPFQTAAVSKTAPQSAQSAQINRTNKTDSLPAVAAQQAPTRITTVEVVGVEDAAIVYRDRDGRVLFKTDPVSNVTVVTKGVVLPEVTIREVAGAAVQRLPAETVRPTLSPTSPGDGCEGAVAAHTGPAEVARVPSRCVTQLPAKSNIAALN